MESNCLNTNIYDKIPDFFNPLVAQFTGREKDIVLLSSLGVLSNCLPNISGNYNNKMFSPHLYLMIIAPPASGKGRMNYCSLLIEKIHQKALTDSSNKYLRWKKVKKGRKPKIDVKMLPGNVSSSKFYTHMNESKYGLLIFESEADSISNMLKQDWGNFSDILRKAFHHEKISISREIDDKFIEINNPQLSMVVSGTEGQVKPLIESKENGLFSRILFYYFNDGVTWKNVKPNEEMVDFSEAFRTAGETINNLYSKLILLKKQIMFQLTGEQWIKLNNTFEYATNIFLENNLNYLIPSVFRYGLILFRVSMIFSAIRNINTLDEREIIICDDRDFEAAHIIIEILLDHTVMVSELFDKVKNKIPIYEYSILLKLPKKFKRADAILIANESEISNSTMDNYLKKWKEKGVIISGKYAFYEKI